jgi:hypothetical protein
MPEEILNDYEHSSGPMLPFVVPYARLHDTTPTESNPCRVTSLLAGTMFCGALITCDAGDSIAVVNGAPGAVYNWPVRNVLTYAAAVEATWGAINVGDLIYYDDSATMPAGVFLSTSPLNNLGTANTRMGVVLPKVSELAALYPLGGVTASTQTCQVAINGIGMP